MKRKAMILAAIAAISLAGAGSVFSQQRGPGWGGGPGWWGGMGPGMMMGRGWGMGPRGMMGMGCAMWDFDDEGDTATFAEGRIAFLKAELKITDAQKDVWDGYAKAVKSNLETMKSMHQAMLASFEGKTPVERLDARINAMETRVKALQEMKPALEKLYTALSDDQKKIANEVLTGMGCMM
jgi:hypothetical protein